MQVFDMSLDYDIYRLMSEIDKSCNFSHNIAAIR